MAQIIRLALLCCLGVGLSGGVHAETGRTTKPIRADKLPLPERCRSLNGEAGTFCQLDVAIEKLRGGGVGTKTNPARAGESITRLTK
jgi:hypothetical protein